MNADLTTLPALRARAEKLAREHYIAQGGLALDWDHWIDGDERTRREAAHLALLADLTRPASRDEVARLVGASLFSTLTLTSAVFYREHHRNGWEWVIEVRTATGYHRCMFGETDAGWDPDLAETYLRIIPGISAITDPAQALRLIAGAVLHG